MKLNPILPEDEQIDLKEAAKRMAGSTCDLTKYINEVNPKLDKCLKMAKSSMLHLNEFVDKTTATVKKHIAEADSLTKDAANAQAVNMDLSKRATAFTEEQEMGCKESMELKQKSREDDIAKIWKDYLDCRKVVIKMVNDVKCLKGQLQCEFSELNKQANTGEGPKIQRRVVNIMTRNQNVWVLPTISSNLDDIIVIPEEDQPKGLKDYARTDAGCQSRLEELVDQP